MLRYVSLFLPQILLFVMGTDHARILILARVRLAILAHSATCQSALVYRTQTLQFVPPTEIVLHQIRARATLDTRLPIVPYQSVTAECPVMQQFVDLTVTAQRLSSVIATKIGPMCSATNQFVSIFEPLSTPPALRGVRVFLHKLATVPVDLVEAIANFIRVMVFRPMMEQFVAEKAFVMILKNAHAMQVGLEMCARTLYALEFRMALPQWCAMGTVHAILPMFVCVKRDTLETNVNTMFAVESPRILQMCAAVEDRAPHQMFANAMHIIEAPFAKKASALLCGETRAPCVRLTVIASTSTHALVTVWATWVTTAK
mmetsp:Transcript_7699/g.28850  ORF Transcript_7699/g.28850 Transcript_7699/m.28850 type:complete len:316 (-) Transcript_7699:9447-10394(-)